MSIAASSRTRLDHSTPARAVPNTRRDAFLDLLPRIQKNAQYAFRRLPVEARQEAIQDTIASALAAYRALVHQDRAEDATATSLARFAIAHYRVGRSISHRMSVCDVSSKYCQYRKAVRIESLHRFDVRNRQWEEFLVEDRQASPADLAAMRIDFKDWLHSLSPRMRRLAEALAAGEETGTVAALFRVSAGRISQIRRELMETWNHFQAERIEPPSLAVA